MQLLVLKNSSEIKIWSLTLDKNNSSSLITKAKYEDKRIINKSNKIIAISFVNLSAEKILLIKYLYILFN